MKERNEKTITLKGEKYTLNAIALDVPSKDLCISIKMNFNMRQSEVIEVQKDIRMKINEWFEESTLLSPLHFIYNIKVPSYRHDRSMPMVFLVDLSLLSRKEISLGKGEGSFKDLFQSEIESLVDYLGIS